MTLGNIYIIMQYFLFHFEIHTFYFKIQCVYVRIYMYFIEEKNNNRHSKILRLETLRNLLITSFIFLLKNFKTEAMIFVSTEHPEKYILLNLLYYLFDYFIYYKFI